MRILVTGITGFVGGHLAEALLARPGVELHGLSRRARWPAEWQHLENLVRLWPVDLAAHDKLPSHLREIQPEQIYHLAGYAHAGRSFQEADGAWSANLTATRRLYEAVKSWGGRPRILFVGSGLIYGEPGRGGPMPDEDAPLRPASPYASSKAAADLVSYEHTRSSGLDIVRARPFNHIGPRQSAEYAVAHFAHQLAAIEQGRQPPVLETGNLQAQRDLTDVRDVVRAYLLLMERGRTGEAYNVAGGRVYCMQSVLDRLVSLVRVPVTVRKAKHLLRPADASILGGNASKIQRETGWKPALSLDRTLEDILDSWRVQGLP
jgi:GDP-4-dehydro-6-deoxy-D-mannose reductase